MATASASAHVGPREPRGVTVADMLALVVGVAVVAWLPWSNWPQFVGRRGPTPWVADPMAWAIVAEGLGKACLAMVPVVLARRARFGGPMRPGEFLAACGGLFWLSWGIEIRLFQAWLTRQLGEVWVGPDYPAVESLQWRKLITWPKTVGLTTLAATAIVVIVIGRKRLPAWVVAAASMLAWIGLLEGGFPLLRDGFSRSVLAPISRAGHPVVANAIGAFTDDFPMFLLVAWFAVVAALGPGREGRQRTLVQWACIALAASAFAAEVGIRVLIDYLSLWSGTRASDFWRELSLKSVALILAIGVSVALFGHLDPARSRPSEI